MRIEVLGMDVEHLLQPLQPPLGACPAIRGGRRTVEEADFRHRRDHRVRREPNPPVHVLGVAECLVERDDRRARDRGLPEVGRHPLADPGGHVAVEMASPGDLSAICQGPAPAERDGRPLEPLQREREPVGRVAVVIVQEGEVSAARRSNASVASRGGSAVRRAPDQPHARGGGQRRGIGARVVDHQALEVLQGLGEH